MNVKDIRRENLRSLAKSKGGISALAKILDKSQSQISHLIGSHPIKNIGDRLSLEIEKKFGKLHGWLDKEHFRVTDGSGIYVISNAAPRVLSWLPVKPWHEIETPFTEDMRTADGIEFVPVNFEVSTESYALRVADDSMDAPIGTSFPRGTVIVVDPSHIPTHSSYVIVTHPDIAETSAVFRQLIQDGHQNQLKPLNPRYEGSEFPEDARILGVVRQLMMKLE